MILSTLYPPFIQGGAERSVSLIANGLAKRGHEVLALSIHDRPEESEDLVEGVRVLRRPLRNIYWPYSRLRGRNRLLRFAFHAIDSCNPPMAATVGRAVREHRPDIILSNQLSCFSAYAWRAARAAGAPILHTIRDFYLLCPRTTMYKGGARCARRCADCRLLSLSRRRFSHDVDGLTGVSRFMVDRHREAGLFYRALVLPPILSAVRIPSDFAPRLLAPPDPVRHFGYIGRVDEEKGIDLLLDGLFAQPRDRWRLSIAGAGSAEYRRHLEARCAGWPVDFLGFMPEAAFYPLVDVVVVPSAWDEPLPRTALEAFAHGLTVIASTRGGIPEVVRPNETGYLVDLDQPEQMAAAMARAIAVPEEGRAFGRAGHRLVASRDDETVAADYETASRRVIEHRQAGGRHRAGGLPGASARA